MLIRAVVVALATVLPFAASSDVPRFADVAGHAIAERIAQSHQVDRWLERLAEASPRVAYEIQGRSWEGRPLMLAMVTSADNHARIDEIRDIARRLDDPRLPAPSTAELARQPVIVWLGGSIHGFELSGTEGLLMLVERLATDDSAETAELLERTVVLVDPMLNPDGRDAFAHRNHMSIGRFTNPGRDDWANDFTPWDGLTFRTGHYFFDTNRDWFAHTQRETRERMPTFRAWRPQVAVDAHEMGPDIEFYFDPPTAPQAPYFPEFATRGFEIFGAAHAAAFDAAGVEYTKRQMFNYFYPGYTTSWTSYQGAIGMLYEQGSSRGLALERSDGTVRTLHEAATQQYTAALAATRAAAANRERLLREYAAAAREAVADGRGGMRRYLVPPTGDPQLTAELAALLERNGIEVHVTTENASLRGLRDARGRRAGTVELAAGTLVIEAAQPRNRLLRTLMEPHLDMPEAFLELARARVDRGENPRFYDITAYSLPLLFNLDAYASGDARAPATRRWAPPTPVAPADAAYAWLIDGRQAASAAVAALLRHDGVRVSIAPKPFRHGGHDFASGTVIVRAGGDGGTVRAKLAALAADFAVEVRGADSGVTEGGLPALGAAETFSLKPPVVGLLGEDPVHALSFGFAWHALDHQYRIPTTVLRSRSLGATALERYTTLVIPALIRDGELTKLLGESGRERITRWVNDGGTLVAIGSGADWVRGTLELGALRSWYTDNEDAQRIAVPGAFVRAELDTEAWLASGYGADLPVLVGSDRVWLAPDGAVDARKRSVARYAQGDALHIAGHLWDENRERLPDAVFLYEERIGRGRIILFAEDPNFRGYWRGADRLFLNAVLLGPSAP